jgi:hypothetical protein
VQEWHGAKDTSSRRITLRTTLQKGAPRGQTFGQKRRVDPEGSTGVWVQAEDGGCTVRSRGQQAGDREANGWIFCRATKYE